MRRIGQLQDKNQAQRFVDFMYGEGMEGQTVIMMIVWFFLCLTGLMGNVANTAHGVGLGVGMAWGFMAARWATQRGH